MPLSHDRVFASVRRRVGTLPVSYVYVLYNGAFGMYRKIVQTSFLVVKTVKYAFSLGLVSRQLGAFS